MLDKINWDLIQSGETFQSLVNITLLFEDSGTNLFGRPGKDAGIDAKSEDSKIAYQAKYHKIADTNKAFSDAKAELKKIKDYRTAGHANTEHWKDVEKWILVTNVTFNPNDDKKWKDEIIPAFKKEGIDASERWTAEYFEEKIIKHPEIIRNYFGGTTRAFLSLPEAEQIIKDREKIDSDLSVPLTGRDEDIVKLNSFLDNDKKLVLIHGTGGLGKSRLLFTAGTIADEKGWDVLWANVETLKQSQNWYESIIPERKTILLVDEPTDPNLLKTIIEQIQNKTGRAGKWKVIITSRTPKDPVIATIKSALPTILDDEIVLKPLTETDAKAIAKQLLNISLAGKVINPEIIDKTGEQIAILTNQYPVWISIAVKVVVERNSFADLPKNTSQLASQYYKEIIEHHNEGNSSKTELDEVVKWVALFKTINIENKELLEFLEALPGMPTKAKIIRTLTSLVKRKFLNRRGINKRIYEIKPDVIRDHILSEWLINENNPSEESKEVAEILIKGHNGKAVPYIETILTTFARTEFLNANTPILEPIIEDLKNLSIHGTAKDQNTIVNILDKISFARVSDTVEIIRNIRENKKPNEPYEIPIFGVNEITHNYVVKKLAWQLYQAGTFAKNSTECKQVFKEMFRLVIAEQKICLEENQEPQNDGKRARQQIEKLITGGPQFVHSYYEIAVKETLEQADALKSEDQLPSIKQELLKSLIDPQIAVERMDTYSDTGKQITFRRYQIDLEGPLGKIRKALIGKLREVIEAENAAINNKILCWKLINESHSSAGRALIPFIRKKGQPPEPLFNDARETLKWTKRRLERGNMSIVELKAAREIWDWHYRFEEEGELKEIADACEKLYKANPKVALFHDMFSHDDFDVTINKIRQEGERLAEITSSKEIFDFLSDAQEFETDKSKFCNIYNLSRYLSPKINENRAIKEFVFQALKKDNKSVEFYFALCIITEWLRKFRENNEFEQLKETLEEILETIDTPDGKMTFLRNQYCRPHPELAGILTFIDLNILENHKELFGQHKLLYFQMLGGIYHIDWERFKTLFEEKWQTTPAEEKGQCFVEFFDTIHFNDLFRNQQKFAAIFLTHGQMEWIFNKFTDIPDIDKIGGLIHDVESLLKNTGKLPLQWFFDTIEKRKQLFPDQSKIIPTRFRLSKFVEPITATSAQTSKLLVEQILTNNDEPNMLGYILPEYISDIDPDGLVAPDIIDEKISQIPEGTDYMALYKWSRYAGYYPKNSDSWKRIALPACKKIINYGKKEKSGIYNSIEEHGIKSYSSAPGTIPQKFIDDLDKAKTELDNETEENFKEYRQWVYDIAHAELEREKGRLEEDEY